MSTKHLRADRRVAGGKRETVAKNDPKGEIEFARYAFIYPAEPEFKSTTEVAFRTGDEENREVTVDRRED